jgi:hypothetical protein
MHGGLNVIKPYVDQFVEYAKAHPMNRFLLTRIGCGIAGFTDEEMAPLFAGVATLPNVAVPAKWLPYIHIDAPKADDDFPTAITDDHLRMLSEKYLYEIGAGLSKFVPGIHIRYVCDNNQFGYTTLDNCFFFDDGGMYIWEEDEKWEEDHNQDVVECVFHDECKGRGYAHRVISAGVSTNIRDSNGEYMYTGDVIEIAGDGRKTSLALGALNAGYGFRLSNQELLLSNCLDKQLTRVGTVFYQLDRNEEPVPVIERVMGFNNMDDSNEKHLAKVLMSKFTPNFEQNLWEYQSLEILGADYHWNK